MHLETVNLLDHFILQHVQVSAIEGKLKHVSKEIGRREAKVELNLTPRMLETDQPEDLPSYQVRARLSCSGGAAEDAGPRFLARVTFEAVYRQIHGEAVDLAEFTANHPSLTRQLYPLLQQELRSLMVRLGLEQVHLPFDIPSRVESEESQAVQVSGAVH